MRRATSLDDLEPEEPPDTMIDVHHQIARIEACRLGQRIAGLFLALGPQNALPQNVLLAEDQQILGFKAGLERQDHQRGGRRTRRLGIAPVFGEARISQPVVLEHLRHAVARAHAPAGDDGPTTSATLGRQPIHHRLEQIGFRRLPLSRKGRGNAAAKIVDTLGARRHELRQLDDRSPRQRVGMLIDAIEQFRLDGLVGRAGTRYGRCQASGLTRFVIIGDLRRAIRKRLDGLLIVHKRRIADIIRQRIQMLIEKWQPVLSARIAGPAADRCIERVIDRIAAKRRGVLLPKPLDALVCQHHFAHRRQIDALELSRGPLAIRVKGADRFELAAEEIEPQRRFGARREQIDQPAAHRIFA